VITGSAAAGRGRPAVRPARAKTSVSSATKRETVAVELAGTSTSSSTVAAGLASRTCSTASAPEVSESVSTNTTAPPAWWRSRPAPAKAELKRRLAAVLPTAVRASAAALAAAGPTGPRRSRTSTA
jgi:hypothetical protein